MRNSRPTCAVPACHIPNRHVEACDATSKCGGCLPALALDGLHLCRFHRDSIGRDALTLAARHRQLGLVLTGTGQPGERTSGGNRNPNMSLNLRAAAVRRDIEQVFTARARLIATQRGFALPAELYVPRRPDGFIGPMPQRRRPTVDITALATYVARSAEWLAGHDRAAEHATTLRELTAAAMRTAFPAGTRVFELPGLDGARWLACPERAKVDGEEAPCPGNLWTILRRDGDRLPAQIMCNHDETHQWPSSQWIKFGRRLMTVAAGSAA